MYAAAIGSDFVPRQVPAAFTVELDGDAVVLDEDQNRLHLLNATAAVVWACCDGSGTLAEIAHDLAEMVGMPFEQVTDQLVELARTLGAEGLLDGVSPDPGPHGIAVPEVEVSTAS